MDWFAGGVVAYTRAAKQRVLGTDDGRFLDGSGHTVLHHFDGTPDDIGQEAAVAALRDLEHRFGLRCGRRR